MSKYELVFELNKFLFNIGCFILSIIRFPSYLKSKNTRLKNCEIKNMPKTQKCYVIGLGPSLKKVDLSKLDGDSIVVNHFYKFGANLNFTPTFYCLLDDVFFTEEYASNFANAYERYPNTKFLLNGKYQAYVEKKKGILTNAYYAYMWKGYFINTKEKLDFTKRVPMAGNVICTAIAFAMYAGYKEIILLGCDFNSFASQTDEHCYYEENAQRKLSLGFLLFCYSFVADTHIELEEYAKFNGVKITNATPGSLIDAYKRVNLDKDLFLGDL